MTKKTIPTKSLSDIADIPEDRFPHHIVIIPDGNGRWAKKRGKFVSVGHKKGFEAAQRIFTMLSTIAHIKIVTMWGFSADNWKRSEKEVTGLMLIFEHVIRQIRMTLKKNKGKFVHIGRKDRIPRRLRAAIEVLEQTTKDNTGQIFCLAIDFGGQDQEIRMLENIREIPISQPVTVQLLWQLRDGGGVIPEADLLIRTSGERRISDIGWLNGAQTEIYFLSKLFPDVLEEDIVEALQDFSKRERRFGGRN